MSHALGTAAPSEKSTAVPAEYDITTAFFRPIDERGQTHVVCLCPTPTGAMCGRLVAMERGKGTSNFAKHQSIEHPYLLPPLRRMEPPTSGNITNYVQATSKVDLVGPLATLLSETPIPFSIVESMPFRRFLQDVGAVRSTDTIPSRRAVTRHVDEYTKTNHAAKVAKFKDAMTSGDGVPMLSLSIDGGQASDARSVVGIIGHTMDDNGVIIAVPLACKPFPSPHTAEAYRTTTQNALTAVGLSFEQLHTFVHDSASNVVVAFDDIHSRSANTMCIVHTINLMLKFSCDNKSASVKSFFKATSKVHSFFSRSSKSREVLRKIQTSLKRDGKLVYPRTLRVRDDVETRFGSTVLQMQRYIDLLPALSELKSAEHGAAAFSKEADYNRFKAALSDFEEVVADTPRAFALMQLLLRWSEVFSATYEATLHLVRLFMRQIRECLDTYLSDKLVPPLAPRDSQLLHDLDNAFDNYFVKKNWYKFPTYRLAEVLSVTSYMPDVPRLDGDAGQPVPDDDFWYDEGWSATSIEEALTDAILVYVPAPAAQPAAAPSAPSTASPAAVNPRAAAFRRVEVIRPEQAHRDTIKDEVSRFIGVISAPTFTLSASDHWYDGFWKANKAAFPTLWKVVRLMLSTPPSSIPVESLFSVLGSVDSRRRRAMTTERLCQVTLSNYLRFQDQRSSSSRTVKIPELCKYDPLDSIERHPSDEEVDGLNVAAAEEVALEADLEFLAIPEHELDDDATVEAPPAKRARIEVTDVDAIDLDDI